MILSLESTYSYVALAPYLHFGIDSLQLGKSLVITMRAERNESTDRSVDHSAADSASRFMQEIFGGDNSHKNAEVNVANLGAWFDWGRGGGSDARRELEKGPPPNSALKDGDIIFHSSHSEQSEAIRLATNSPLSHCGILFKENGKWMVYEAVQPVKKTPLEQWAKRGEDGQYVVRRLKDESALDEKSLATMKNYLKSNLGKNYDLHFGWSDDRIYCSELVWKAYFKATGDKVGEVKPMREYDFSKPEVRKKVEQRWGKKLPLDELMVTPAGIYESRLLKTVR